MIIKTKKLGLAGYIKVNGGSLVSKVAGVYSFESDKTSAQWSVEYMNSCCYKHDIEVINLRRLEED